MLEAIINIVNEPAVLIPLRIFSVVALGIIIVRVMLNYGRVAVAKKTMEESQKQLAEVNKKIEELREKFKKGAD